MVHAIDVRAEMVQAPHREFGLGRPHVLAFADKGGGMGGVVRFFKPVVAILLLPLCLGFVQESISILVRNIGYYARSWFLYGLFGYVLFYVVGLRGYVRFFSHYVHESTHALAAFLTLRQVRKLLVNPRPDPGEKISHVEVRPGILEFVSCLAPYCLPLLTLPFLLAKLLVTPPLAQVVDLLIGITMGFFYMDLLTGFGKSSTDFPEAGGSIFSTFIIVLVNAIVLAIVLSFVSTDYPGILEYLRASWLRSLEHYNTIIQAWHEVRRSL